VLWWRVAKTQVELDAATAGEALLLGDFQVDETDIFWVRVSVPDGQVGGIYTDVVLQVQAEAVGPPPEYERFSIDAYVEGGGE